MAEHKEGCSICAFITGIVIGAGLGILLAPRSGKDTRKKLNSWLDDAMEKGKDVFEKAGDELKHKRDQIAQALSGKK